MSVKGSSYAGERFSTDKITGNLGNSSQLGTFASLGWHCGLRLNNHWERKRFTSVIVHESSSPGFSQWRMAPGYTRRSYVGSAVPQTRTVAFLWITIWSEKILGNVISANRVFAKQIVTRNPTNSSKDALGASALRRTYQSLIFKFTNSRWWIYFVQCDWWCRKVERSF